MRVFVAIRTLIERNAHILRLSLRPIRVAFRALYLLVQSGQGIPGFRVIELLDLDRFPVLIVVALQAVLAEPAFVLILVARHAGGRKA